MIYKCTAFHGYVRQEIEDVPDDKEGHNSIMPRIAFGPAHVRGCHRPLVGTLTARTIILKHTIRELASLPNALAATLPSHVICLVADGERDERQPRQREYIGQQPIDAVQDGHERDGGEKRANNQIHFFSSPGPLCRRLVQVQDATSIDYPV